MSPAVAALLRTEFLAFFEKVFEADNPGVVYQPNWHIEHLAYKMTCLIEGQTRRMVIAQPPRTGKSLMCSVALPLFLIGRDPTIKIINLSHTMDLAREFNLKRLRIAQSDWFLQVFPDCRLRFARDTEFQTTAGGGCFAAGMTGPVTGRGAHYITIDDPLKGRR